ncbi:MAG: hypothetical protein RLZZ347_722 [Candidatus Parcubacteria bacterium]|jgi:hypothetical protein
MSPADFAKWIGDLDPTVQQQCLTAVGRKTSISRLEAQQIVHGAMTGGNYGAEEPDYGYRNQRFDGGRIHVTVHGSRTSLI